MRDHGGRVEGESAGKCVVARWIGNGNGKAGKRELAVKTSPFNCMISPRSQRKALVIGSGGGLGGANRG